MSTERVQIKEIKLEEEILGLSGEYGVWRIDPQTGQKHFKVTKKSYEKKGIQLLTITERRGKENAQKEAVKRASGDVLVFTDVATMLNHDGLKQIVFNFADPSIGCVSRGTA